MSQPSGSRTVLGIGIALFVVLVAAAFRRPPIDDTYITLRYAWNLANGLGFVYNAGEPVLGTTTPLWTLILAACFRLGGDGEEWSVLLSGIAAAAVLGVFLGRLVIPRFGAFVALGWGALAAFFYPLHLTIFSGMETLLYIAASVAAIGLSISRRPVLAGVASGIAFLLRPDGVCALMATLVAQRRAKASLIFTVLAFALTILPWTVFAVWSFGSLVPHSVIAKRVLYPTPPLTNFLMVLEGFQQTPLDAIVFCAGAAGLFLGRKVELIRLAGIWTILYLAGLSLSGVRPIFFWYFAPVWFVLLTVGILPLVERCVPLATPLRTAGAFACLVLWCAYGGLQVTNGDGSAERERVYRAIAPELASKLSQDDVVLAGETGIIGYGLPNARVYDTAGIVTPRVTEILAGERRKSSKPYAEFSQIEGWLLPIVEAVQPRAIVGIRNRSDFAAAERTGLLEGYELVRRDLPGHLGGIQTFVRK